MFSKKVMLWISTLISISAVKLYAFNILKVSGNSMEPTLRDGDYVVTLKIKLIPFRSRSGDIVVLKDPRTSKRQIIKRLVVVDRNYGVLVGDQPGQSTDSRIFGSIKLEMLDSKVIKILRRLS